MSIRATEPSALAGHGSVDLDDVFSEDATTYGFWLLLGGSTHFRVLSCPFPGPCTSPKALVDGELVVQSGSGKLTRIAR